MSEGLDFRGMGEGEGSASREPLGAPYYPPHARSRLCLWAPLQDGGPEQLPCLLFCPTLTGPLSRGWAVGPAQVLASSCGITGSSEAGAGCCLPGRGPWGPLLCPLGSAPPPGRCSGSPVSCRWVQEFLNEENRGLDVLLEYLAFAQCSVA